MAERTPYFLASYDAVATTPRPPVPPTTTGLPRSDGLSRCSTAAKNASRSRWRTEAWSRTGATYRAAPTAWRAEPRVVHRSPLRRAVHRRAPPRPASSSASAGNVPVMTTTPAPPTRLTAKTPEDLLAAVPVVLGFEPSRLRGDADLRGGETFHARIDLPQPTEQGPVEPDELDAAVELLREPAARHRVESVVVRPLHRRRGAGPPAPRPAWCGRSSAPGSGWWRRSATDGTRWFSPADRRSRRRGCPTTRRTHRFRAQSVLDGRVIHGSREELAALLSPGRASHGGAGGGAVQPGRRRADEVRRLVGRRIGAGRFTDEELATLLVSMAAWRVRDAVWAGFDAGKRRARRSALDRRGPAVAGAVRRRPGRGAGAGRLAGRPRRAGVVRGRPQPGGRPGQLAGRPGRATC